MVYSSIWKDTYYTTTASSLTYRITLDGEVIYSGKAVKMPGSDNLNIRLNRICGNYLESDIADLFTGSTTYITNYDALRTFTLTNSAGTQLEQYTFLKDYSYDQSWSGGATTLSNPINGHYTDGMLKLKTNVTSSNAVRTYKSDGNYPTQVQCADVALYYLNAKGGWDAFLIEGRATKKDTITQYTTDQVFNNTTYEFEKNRYVAEIATSYELVTGYLTDEQSAKFAKNLVSSNKVYMHHLKEGWIKPVVIDDTSVTYQTYRGNNRKMSQYKLTVSFSQSKIRK